MKMLLAITLLFEFASFTDRACRVGNPRHGFSGLCGCCDPARNRDGQVNRTGDDCF